MAALRSHRSADAPEVVCPHLWKRLAAVPEINDCLDHRFAIRSDSVDARRCRSSSFAKRQHQNIGHGHLHGSNVSLGATRDGCRLAIEGSGSCGMALRSPSVDDVDMRCPCPVACSGERDRDALGSRLRRYRQTRNIDGPAADQGRRAGRTGKHGGAWHQNSSKQDCNEILHAISHDFASRSLLPSRSTTCGPSSRLIDQPDPAVFVWR